MTRVIGIVSGKGGVGKTTFATNLGVALNTLDKKILVVDCNITAPHVAYYLGARDYSTTLNNVLRGEVDVRFAPSCQSGVMFIPSSEEVNELMKVDINDLKNYIKSLDKSEKYDYIVLDSAPGLGKEALSVLEACDEIIFITTPTIPTIMDMTRCAEVANKLGHRKFKVVFNMVRKKKFELKEEDAEKFFGVPVLGTIPFDEDIMDSTAQGIPFLWFKPRSSTSKHFRELAENLVGIKHTKQSIFNRASKRFRRIFKRERI